MRSNLLSLARDLQRRRARRRRRLALVEGWRLVDAALEADVPLRGALVDRSAGGPSAAAVLRRMAEHAVELLEVDADTLASLSSTETPQGILAIAEPAAWSIDGIVPGPATPVLVVDGVQDPGNVGALVRSAHALGAAGAILLPGTADVLNPRVIRGAMGSTFRLPCVALTDGEFAAWVRRTGVAVLVTDSEGTPLERMTRGRPTAVVVGNEGVGIRPEIRAIATEVVAIPLSGGVESLNVAVAGGIVLHEVRRA